MSLYGQGKWRVYFYEGKTSSGGSRQTDHGAEIFVELVEESRKWDIVSGEGDWFRSASDNIEGAAFSRFKTKEHGRSEERGFV